MATNAFIGKRDRAPPLMRERRKDFRALQLLTAKPVLYVLNVGEAEAATGNALSDTLAGHAADTGAGSVVIAAAIEAEVAT